jgi:hypothetical protein
LPRLLEAERQGRATAVRIADIKARIKALPKRVSRRSCNASAKAIDFDMTRLAQLRKIFQVIPPNGRGYRPDIDGLRAIAGVSFSVNIWHIAVQQSSSAFYLPAARAWELMVGAWLAIGHQRQLPWLSRKRSCQSWGGADCIGHRRRPA